MKDEPKIAVVTGDNKQLQLYALAAANMNAGHYMDLFLYGEADVCVPGHMAPFLADPDRIAARIGTTPVKAKDFPEIFPSSNPRWMSCRATMQMEPSMNPDVATVVAAAAEAVKRPDIPNRVCAYEGSEYFWPCKIPGAKLAVRFNGLERRGDVVEFDVAEGWIRIHVRNGRGKFKQERGQWVTTTLKGTVEPFWKE